MKQGQDGRYFYDSSLGETFGTGFMGYNLDECMEKIIWEVKNKKVKEVTIKSKPKESDHLFKYKTIPFEDLELLVFCLSEECSDTKFKLNQNQPYNSIN